MPNTPPPERAYDAHILPLHAGAVEYNGKAILFPASTGTGKTTLTAFLSESGCRYVSDDEVLIDLRTLCVKASPKPLHLREAGLSVLADHGIRIEGTLCQIEQTSRIVYLPRHLASGELPIGLLFFLKRGETNACRPIPPEEAVRLLMQNLMTPKVDMPACLRAAIRLAPLCRRLCYREMNYVKEILSS